MKPIARNAFWILDQQDDRQAATQDDQQAQAQAQAPSENGQVWLCGQRLDVSDALLNEVIGLR